tara:strand:- start:1168 stop:2832 length:1665 start_codon:yes stop_codon:yes gene_type:complete
MANRIPQFLIVSLYTMIVLGPLILAFDRLIWVAGFNPSSWFDSLNENYISQGVLTFTITQAIFSTIFTLVIGIPIAWQLGRYSWKFEPLIKAILTMPFVMPSIIVAMGFLQIVGNNGLDIRNDSSTWLITLIIAHAWFNVALVIRFCEPVLSNLSPNYLEQIKLLPGGETSLKRFRNLWVPIMAPSVIAAACMTFIFSFTSFALVKWITVGDKTLESMMADIGSSAGISNYMINHNEIILGAAIIQFCVLGTLLWLVAAIQQKRQKRFIQASDDIVKERNNRGWMVIGPAIFFALIPLIIVTISSFRIRKSDRYGTTYDWNFSAWEYAFSNNYSLASANEAFMNSLGYAALTLCVAVPIGYMLASTISTIEIKKPLLGKLLDVLVMIPFAVSSVMIGLGVMLGMIKIDAQFFYSLWFTPIIAHVMITTPFVVRILLSGQRSISAKFDECGRVLGLSDIERFVKIKLPMMKNSIFIAGIFTIAMSLGEFGASWVVTRNSDWITLPILIDTLRGVPFDKTLTVPASCAVASILMILTIITFTLAEKYRKKANGGMF